MSRRKRKQVKRKTMRQAALRWLLVILVLMIGLFGTYILTGTRFRAADSSMAPTIEFSDQLIVDRILYKFSDPKRFDLVVFPLKHQDSAYAVRRVIGLPGETVRIQNGAVYINGSLLEEDAQFGTCENAGLAADSITLGEDEYFVLGDQRNDCSDSRHPGVGNIEKNRIVGKVVVRVWPLDRLGLVD